MELKIPIESDDPVAGPMRKRVVLAEPGGFRAGVVRAIATVERAPEVYGAPVHVRKQIVHNHQVIETPERGGARFVESEGELPEGAVRLFSAPGVSPRVRADPAARGRGVTSGASAPEILVGQLVDRPAELGFRDVEIDRTSVEDVTFSMPARLATADAAAAGE